MKAFEINEVFLADDLQYMKYKAKMLGEYKKVSEEILGFGNEDKTEKSRLLRCERIGVLLEQMDELQQELTFQLEITARICELYEKCEDRITDEIARIRLN